MIGARPSLAVTLAAVLLCAAAAEAQLVPEVARGTRVRVTHGGPAPRVRIGSFDVATHDALVIRAGERLETIPLASVRRLEASRGRKPGIVGGAAGLLLGAAVGGVLGCAANSDSYGVFCAGQSDTKVVGGAVIGGLIGGAAGALLFRRERWRDIAVTPPAPAHGSLPDTATLPTRVAIAATIAPSARQLAWQRRELTAFLHFGINTFTDREWGDGTESPAQFDPTDFDARQWMTELSAAGVQLVILTAKHHDGFCLWPSAQTEHSVKHSPWRGGAGDVVREVADAARAAGIAFGFYLSPWDRHEPSYGTARYDDFFVAQLRELLTGYGPVAEVWLDGARGAGVTHEYDWERYYATIRELQPDAVIAVKGPDVRWVGTESGYGRETEWSVVATPSADAARAAAGTWLPQLDEQAPDLGSRARLASAGALFWYPAEVDVSIRPGWFHHAAEDTAVKSARTLLDIYHASVGRNATLLLNVPPDARGRIAEPDARTLRAFGDALRATFAVNLAAGVHGALTDDDPATVWRAPAGDTTATLMLDLAVPRTFDVLRLREDITTGQRVEAFAFDVEEAGAWRTVAQGTTIGYSRLLRFDAVTTRRVRVRITAARAAPALAELGLYRGVP